MQEWDIGWKWIMAMESGGFFFFGLLFRGIARLSSFCHLSFLVKVTCFLQTGVFLRMYACLFSGRGKKAFYLFILLLTDILVSRMRSGIFSKVCQTGNKNPLLFFLDLV
jgi:hypothetical protein